MADEYGIEVGIDSRPAESGADRTVRSLNDIKEAANRTASDVSRSNDRQASSHKKAAREAKGNARSMDDIRAKARGATNRTEEFGRATANAGNRARRASSQYGQMNNQLTRTEAIVGKLGPLLLRYLGSAAIATAIGRSIKASNDFGDALAEVSTLVDTAVFDMERLRQASLKNAVAFSSSPAEQAKAFYQIISAGASTAAEAQDILTAANKLAVGGVTDVTTAADGLTSTLNAYGIAATESESVTDAFFVAMKAGKTTIEELAGSIGKVAPLAAQAGVSLEELLASTAALTKGGISTREAMTGLRAIMAAVVKPTKEATDLAAQLGVQFNAAGLESKGLKGFLDELFEATGGNTEQLAQMFGGVEALVPVLALAGKAGADFSDILEDMQERGGATAEAYEKIASSPGFKWGQLLAAIQVAAIQLGDALSTVLLPVVSFLAENMETLIGVFKVAAAGLLAYFAATKLTTGAMGTMISLVATTTARFGVLAGAQVALAGATGALSVVFGAATNAVRAFTVALLANPVTALITAITIVIALLVEFGDKITLGEGRLATLADVAAVVWEDIKTGLEFLSEFMAETWQTIAQFFRDNFGPLADFVAGVWNQMSFSLAGLARFTAKVVDGIVGFFRGAYRAVVAAWNNLPAAFANLAGRAVNGLAALLEAGVNKVITGINSVLELVGLDTFSQVKLGRVEVQASNFGSAVGGAFMSGFEFSGASDYVEGVLGRAEKRATERQAAQARAAAASANEAAAAQTNLANAAGDAAKALGGSGGSGGSAGAAEKASDSSKELARDLERLTAKYDPLKKLASDYADELERIQRLQDAGTITQDRANFFRGQAEDAYNKERAEAFGRLIGIEAIEEQARAERKLAEENKKRMREAAEELERRGIEAGYAIADAIGGRAGDLLGKLFGFVEGFKTGNYQGVGGPLGQLMTLFTQRGKDEEGTFGEGGLLGLPGSRGKSPFFDAFDDALSDVMKEFTRDMEGIFEKLFGKGGLFGETLGGVLGKAAGGAAIGAQINPLVGALGLPSSNTGAQIGGAIGSFVPIPGGEIIGSIAGSILGGLFKKKKYGTAVLTGGGEGDISVRGNKSSFRGTATGLGGEVQAGLANIADQLGATIGSFRVSIGQYKDNFRVSNTGRTGKLKGKYSDVTGFGDDSSAAIAFAIQEAIRQGAIQGLDAASDRVLRSASDVEQGLNAILAFRDVKKQLRELEDPVRATFEEIKDNFDQLRKTLLAAGYTAAELADLDKLYTEQRKAALEDTTQGFRDLIDELTNGPNSGKTVFQQFLDAQATLDGFRADIAAGNSVDQDAFTNAGQDAFALARQVFGTSTPEFEAFKADLVELTNQAIDNAESRAEEFAPVIEEIRAGNERSDEQNQEIIDLLRSINAGVAPGYGFGGGGGFNFDNLARVNF